MTDTDARPGVASPTTSVRGVGGAVATADQAATLAGIAMLRRGGNAVDAAIAANAAIAVVGPHLCGMGGDLFALVCRDGEVTALNASGRAGSGADPERLRAEGHRTMPFRHDVRSVTVPGCVDGWLALHARFGTVPLSELLEPAIRLAASGFTARPLMLAALARDEADLRPRLGKLGQARSVGDVVARPGVAEALRAIIAKGRDGFYDGPFGAGLLAMGDGWFSAADLADLLADWVTPLSTSAFGVELHTIPPNSQGYLTLGAARLAHAIGLPDDPADSAWAHLLIECATAAGHDRPAVLHEDADGAALLAAIDARLPSVDPDRASTRPSPAAPGDTTYLCVVDGDGMGVSLIQSNAAGFGSGLVEANTGINLHNRGLGFSLAPGHPAELGPRRRPPHTLAPALATRGSQLAAVFGTMGGDAQPQILLQLAARMFGHRSSPNAAIRAGRWALRGPETGFDTWTAPTPAIVQVEQHAPAAWIDDLARRGHAVEMVAAYDSAFGHAHAIVVEPNGVLAGAADPRTVVGTCAAL